MARPDFRAADAVAVRKSMALLDGPLDLTLPTPCAGWTLADLVAHMTAQHRGFAAAARGGGADGSVWKHDPADSYAEAAEDVIAAFAGVGSLDAPFMLPEINAGEPFPAWQAMSFHLVDYVVHGWDVARTLSLTFSLPVDVFAATLPIAERVPDGPTRLRPGAGFAPGLPVAEDASTLDRILALLGRSPAWPE